MLKIKEAIVVEGRYDKNTLSQVVDTVIIETFGFGIFKNREQLTFIRRLADKRGLILLTDSDSAGFLIRNYLKSALNPAQVKHAYIPDRYGKEKRKRTPGKEGKLGVEGMSPTILEGVLRQAGATILGEDEQISNWRFITKADLYLAGFVGTPDAAGKRKKLLKQLDLPEKMNPNTFLEVLNTLYGYEGLTKLGVLPKMK